MFAEDIQVRALESFKSKQQEREAHFAGHGVSATIIMSSEIPYIVSIVHDLPDRPVGTSRRQGNTLENQHQSWSTISCSLQSTEEQLQNQGMRGKESRNHPGGTVDCRLVGGTVLDFMQEGILVATGDLISSYLLFTGFSGVLLTCDLWRTCLYQV